MDSSQAVRPPVTWAERKETAFITIDLPPVDNEVLDLEETGLKFSGVCDNKKYALELHFPEQVVTAESKCSHHRGIQILLKKKEPKRWHKITTEEGKMHWLKCDWNKWVDTDDEEEQALGHHGMEDYSNMDFSQFENFDDMDDQYGDDQASDGDNSMGSDHLADENKADPLSATDMTDTDSVQANPTEPFTAEAAASPSAAS